MLDNCTRTSNIIIHHTTYTERESFKVNKEDHLIPILCDEIKQALSKETKSKETKSKETKSNSDESSTASTASQETPSSTDGVGGGDDIGDVDDVDDVDAWKEAQEPCLLDLLSIELGCVEADILDFEVIKRQLHIKTN